MQLDDTHDPALTSWVDSAQADGTDFPIQNLPFGRFRRRGGVEPWRIGVAIGDEVLDLRLAREQGRWSPDETAWLAPLAEGDLNAFMAQGPRARRGLRARLSQALRSGSDDARWVRAWLVPQSQVEMDLPCRVGDYTDFYTGIHHATSVGKLFRPDNPLLPNYHWVPIGYHGRSSSLRVSGHAFHRPVGQMKTEAATPEFGPCRRLDYELELGALIGPGNELGTPVPMAEAEDQLFGLVLLNDWSARDIQAWEYQPLGPFLAKNFASTVSPWVVTMEALAPFRAPFSRDAALPQPLPYLDAPSNRTQGAIDMTLSVWLRTEKMASEGAPAVQLSTSNFKDAFWTLAQLVAHHSSNGCNLQPGDLLGTGTQSGPAPEQGGSLLELSQGGRQPIRLPNGETRTFLADGDTVILKAVCEKPGARRIGLGECVATVRSARIPAVNM